MTHPLIDRLETELGWPRLRTMGEVADFTARPGAHCLFIPGDPVRNLETTDAAVVLPELVMTFQRAFDCAIVDDGIEAALRDATRALRTPGFLFYREGRYLGSIEKIRDWSDYMARISHLLGMAAA
ncbi:hydrogenase accessory protein [Cereibacter sphaeroides]|uniref:hydrogenase accessory protein n=1 Tax=Rhodobacterales TaxID=204455 RepID=UPI000BBF1701|nr:MULTISPECIES: hydrogenase accessory protein [Paracoccaceae]MCE6950204.1 hydrogenase accessory protein [Cereibacter sphaeroides]MCE6957934.1 hydrogenase accessory protein [Cereibacter sphaeroides]MCE6967979.1 hydrogenase accessory protein [Cereibacter sphaeroides]MCE6972315.1 hydrogenase accessory protein [Cereibacter sphaeroides]